MTEDVTGNFVEKYYSQYEVILEPALLSQLLSLGWTHIYMKHHCKKGEGDKEAWYEPTNGTELSPDQTRYTFSFDQVCEDALHISVYVFTPGINQYALVEDGGLQGVTQSPRAYRGYIAFFSQPLSVIPVSLSEK